MIKILLHTVLIFILYSCKKESKLEVVDNNALKISPIALEKSKDNHSKIKLDFFKAVPDTIDGCGEFYTIESEKDESQNFIFLSNFSSFGIIKVNGKDVFLEKKPTKSKAISDDEIFNEYEGIGIKVIIKTKLKERFDEGGFYTGTLKLIYKNDEVVYKIKGESGC
nr:hypothetical protein [uncultured Flavobacterium sp.]